MKNSYQIARGVGNPVEFKGLKGMYIFLFAGSVIGSFLLTILFYFSGMPQLTAVLIGACLMGGSCTAVSKLNAKYGQWGIIKVLSSFSRPRFIVRRRSICLYKY